VHRLLCAKFGKKSRMHGFWPLKLFGREYAAYYFIVHACIVPVPAILTKNERHFCRLQNSSVSLACW